MAYGDWSDDELIEELRAMDGEDTLRVTTWEAEFMDSIFTKNEGGGYPLSGKQRDVITSMIDKYKGKY